MVQSAVAGQEIFHEQVSDDMRETRDRQRRVANQGPIPEFAVGKFVLLGCMRKRSVAPMPFGTWTGSCRVVTTSKKHVLFEYRTSCPGSFARYMWPGCGSMRTKLRPSPWTSATSFSVRSSRLRGDNTYFGACRNQQHGKDYSSRELDRF